MLNTWGEGGMRGRDNGTAKEGDDCRSGFVVESVSMIERVLVKCNPESST